MLSCQHGIPEALEFRAMSYTYQKYPWTMSQPTDNTNNSNNEPVGMDVAKCQQYWNDALSTNHASPMYHYAIECWRGQALPGDRERAVSMLFRSSCIHNHAPSMLMLATLHRKGEISSPLASDINDTGVLPTSHQSYNIERKDEKMIVPTSNESTQSSNEYRGARWTACAYRSNDAEATFEHAYDLLHGRHGFDVNLDEAKRMLTTLAAKVLSLYV
jgi:TPR repeat protein